MTPNKTSKRARCENFEYDMRWRMLALDTARDEEGCGRSPEQRRSRGVAEREGPSVRRAWSPRYWETQAPPNSDLANTDRDQYHISMRNHVVK